MHYTTLVGGVLNACQSLNQSPDVVAIYIYRYGAFEIEKSGCYEKVPNILTPTNKHNECSQCEDGYIYIYIYMTETKLEAKMVSYSLFIIIMSHTFLKRRAMQVVSWFDLHKPLFM